MKKKDPRLERAGVSGYNKPKRTPNHPTKSHVVVAKEGDKVKTSSNTALWVVHDDQPGDKIGNFVFLRREYRGKNRIWVCQCRCGAEKVFWKRQAILNQKSCGCLTDETGLTGKQRRSLRLRMGGYINGAKKRNLIWDLSFAEFAEITSQDCTYCGAPPVEWDCMSCSPSIQKDTPNQDFELYKIKFTGIDRMDSSVGYIKENCAPCCTNCNRAKSDMSYDEFKEHVARMYKWLHHSE